MHRCMLASRNREEKMSQFFIFKVLVHFSRLNSRYGRTVGQPQSPGFFTPRQVRLGIKLAEMDDSTNPSAMDLDDDVSSSASGTESEGSQATNPTPTREYLLHKAKHTTTGRVVEAIKCPPNRPLAHEKLFDAETGKPNAVKLKKWFRKEGRLHKDDILHIVSEASAILRKEPNLLSVSSPITGTS